MTKKNLFYAQSGGVTAVINATAAGVIETAKKYPDKISKTIAGLNGIKGTLNENLVDTSKDSSKNIAALLHTPSGAYGSCRYRLQDFKTNPDEYKRLIDIFAAHNIGYFLYNGGGDSQDTTLKVAQVSKKLNYPLTCIGIPKTVDNDLPYTDNCPGFGSVAKYVATSTLEAGFDVASMCETSTKVFILEVMGRYTGWIAAASGLAARKSGEPPHIILFPEIAFDKAKFLRKVKETVNTHNFCVIVVAEGTKDKRGRFLSEGLTQDAFGHAQLGGAAPKLAELIKQKLGFKYHWAVADYLQRSARHIASQTDVDQAYSLGCAAVAYAVEGRQDIMTSIIRKRTNPYRWTIGSVPLQKVANKERKLPRNFISADGFYITKRCHNYLSPLIQGQAHPPYQNGLPTYVRLRNVPITKKLKPWKS